MKETSTANLLLMLLGLGGIALLFVVWWYFQHFGPALSNQQEVWGQFGDYLGGTLNPIFGFLTLVAIVMTLAVQTRQLEVSAEQLRLSRAELEATREELRKSAEAQQETAASLSRQAHLSALAARISAVAAAISVIDQQLNRQQMTSASRIGAAMDPGGVRARREALDSKLQELVREAENV